MSVPEQDDKEYSLLDLIDDEFGEDEGVITEECEYPMEVQQ